MFIIFKNNLFLAFSLSKLTQKRLKLYQDKYMYVCMYLCMYVVCMYVYIYIYIYIYISKKNQKS